MAVYKRIKLFVNESFVSEDMVVYDEVWTSKLSKSESDYRVFKYRIRYYSSKNPMAFGFGPEAEAEDMASIMEEYGPAISCYLEVWNSGKWSRCLDWFGDVTATAEEACMELNDQYRSFITGIPLSQTPYTPKATPNPPDKYTPSKPGKNEKQPNKFSGSTSNSKTPVATSIDDLIKKYTKTPADKNTTSEDDSDDDLDWI
jgi:hypothetical protein